MTEMPELTVDEARELKALAETIGALHGALMDEEAGPAGLRMAVSVIRAGANVLDGLADRWEQQQP